MRNDVDILPRDCGRPAARPLRAGLGHQGTLAFSFVVLVEKDDDPVGLPAKLVRPRGVRVERSEMPVAAHGVEQR